MAAKGMRLVRRTSYAQDLDRIVDHLAKDNPSAPFDMWDEIERQVQPLRDFPHSGRAGRIPKTRELVVTGTPFVVIYMVDLAEIGLIQGVVCTHFLGKLKDFEP
ncbi:type II toxin-antitoxin system RelE/ParE family toxin [Sinorhizobium meliloti]|uniref:type II toxin-antitoxin system RelE/ParE family toxin n=1 Tax=Rhizobium meliloti TaxID=382 RepID=UPI001F16AFBC|nr:type II toxin-antitoxin system RelE/ParE family toxin [Sinorhizobium meliloti]